MIDNRPGAREMGFSEEAGDLIAGQGADGVWDYLPGVC